MKISGDNRILSHFFRDEKSPVYTIIYPPQHSLKERVEYIDDLLVEMKTALKKENELKKEYDDSKSKLTFEEWLKGKFEKEKAEKEAKVEEVKDIPVETMVKPKLQMETSEVKPEQLEEVVVEEVKKD